MTETGDELRSIGRAARVLFVAFAVVRVLDLAGVPVDPLGTLILVLAAAMILAHVAATIIGTSRRNAAQDPDSLHEFDGDRVAAASELAREQTRIMVLHRDIPLSRHVLVWSVAGAMIAAAAMAAITFRAWPRVGVLGALIVETSAALMGAYFGFMAARITTAAKSAFRQAVGVANPRT